MGLPSFFNHWLVTDRTAEMAERVAGRSRMAVWQRVSQRLGSLGAAEARGYVRARALVVIHDETDRLIEQEGQKLVRHRQKIVDLATGAIIRMIASQLEQKRLQQRRAA
jgi:hypothetical protein